MISSLPEVRLDEGLARALRGLRDRLRSLRYTDDGVRETLATPPAAENTEWLRDLWLAAHEPRRRRTAFDSVVEALTHLFLLEGSVTAAVARALLGPRILAKLLDAGVLAAEGPWISAEVLLIPWRDLWLLADTPTHRRAREAVFIPDGSTHAVAALLPSGGGRHAVDIGTGSGILALAESERFERVLALDVNPRAVAFARFNSALNGRPVAVERCDPDPLGPSASLPREPDLVTFVMPFVYSTLDDTASLALVGEDGPGLLERTYRGLGEALGPDGTALLWHQVPRRPPGAFERTLARWGVVPRHHVVLHLAAMSDDLDLGTAIVRRGLPRDRETIVRVDRSATGRLRWTERAGEPSPADALGLPAAGDPPRLAGSRRPAALAPEPPHPRPEEGHRGARSPDGFSRRPRSGTGWTCPGPPGARAAPPSSRRG